MKKITCALLSSLFITPCLANIHISPDAVEEVIATYFPTKQADCLREYNAQLKESSGTGISAEKIWKVCTAGGLDIKQSAGKEQCKKFVLDLTRKGKIKFYSACGKDKKISGAICVDDFSGLTVTMDQATGLAKLYTKNKGDKTVKCRTKPRIDTQTFNSVNIHAMGMSTTTNTPYVQCTSYNSNTFYEFRFNNVDGNNDKNNLKNLKTGICKIFGSKYTTKELRTYTFDVCEDITDENVCNKIDGLLFDSNIGFVSSWGALGAARLITGNAYDYCMLYEQVAKSADGTLLFEQTAFGLDGRVFLKAGIQRKGSSEIKQQIRTYVENTLGKDNVTSFSCEDNHHTVKLQGRSGTDDMVRCKVNGQTVEFFFDDLSEAWNTYDESGREAMNCIAWGGTFTGKKCIGLDEEKCNIVRDANAQSCPECKKIKWNEEAKVCELPASVSATNLKKGLTYSAIVGGAVVSVAITIGTAGAGGVTVGTAIVMIVETAGASIELTSQIIIDNKADNFFTESATCNSQSCAEELVIKYLEDLSKMGRDLTEAEKDAADKEMSRLLSIIPTDSYWWFDYLKSDNGTPLLEKESDGWTAAQIWRAVGIGMQFAGIASSITGWIIRKSGYLEKTLDRTSRILLSSARTAEKNIVKVEKLSDIDKEFYTLWKEYAPKNQTFEQFKAMSNGDLNQMKQMAKGWIPRSKRPIITAQIDKQIDELSEQATKINDKYQKLLSQYTQNGVITEDEIARIYREHPEVENTIKSWEYTQSEIKKLKEAKVYYNNTSYSTFDPEFNKTFKSQTQIDAIVRKRKELEVLNNDYEKEIEALEEELAAAKKFEETSGLSTFDRQMELYGKIREVRGKEIETLETINKGYDDVNELKKTLPTQWEVAEKHPLKNIGNVVQERADDFAEIIKNNPEIESKLNDFSWTLLSDEERASVAQKILDEYAAKTGTPLSDVRLEVGDYGGYHTTGTNNVVLNPNAQMKHSDGMVETMAHEHGHLIDDLAPNEGALGEQYNYFTNKIYSSNEAEGYRVALTEQASFKTGPNVSHSATGTNSSYYGKEYGLEEAKQELLTAEKTSDIGTALTVGGVPTLIGITNASVETAIDNKYKKIELEKVKDKNNDN